nr:phage regulatory CII family protein [uncultured Shewanella sp.]
MYSTSPCTQTPTKAAHQPHVAGALRQFADGEQLSDIAIAAKFAKPQLLRNKLLLNQPHQLSIHEAVDIAKASGNRCIIDGMLFELGCAPSMAIEDLDQCERMSLTDRALEISANAGWLGNMALDVKARRGGVSERMRHEAVKRASVAMSQLAIFVHDVEQKFQAVPLLSVAFDAVQTMPMPGVM